MDDTIWYYGAPITALTINDNTIWADIQPGDRPGEPARIRLDPFASYFSIDNRVVTAGTSSTGRVSINREPGTRVFEFWGRIPAGDRVVRESLARLRLSDLPVTHVVADSYLNQWRTGGSLPGWKRRFSTV